MLPNDSSVPFFLMGNKNEFQPGVAPSNPRDEIIGLEGAIKNTKKRIVEEKKSNADTTEFDVHLKNLEHRLEKARKRT